MEKVTFHTRSPEETGRLAAEIAGLCRAGSVLLLEGELGAGKTTFARGFIQALAGKETAVTSPTFTLVQVYDTPQGKLWHCDLYRLKAEEELYELGLEEAFAQAITLIEWPDIARPLLPESVLTVEIHVLDDGGRDITLTSKGARALRLAEIIRKWKDYA